MRRVFFEPIAHKQFLAWERFDKKIFHKIAELIAETREEPFKGTGKPEPLKHKFSGYWSRRITKEHRLVYKVTDESIIIISCKYHY